jgi:hypothetical protein
MEAVTPAGLQEAERRWEANGAASYHLVVRVRAPRFAPAVYDVRVAEGKLVEVERDGAALSIEEAGRHDFSVAGLFGLLREDLPLAGAHPIGTAPPIDLRARFDPATGRLERYRRTVGTKRRRVLLVEVLAYEPLTTPCPA